MAAVLDVSMFSAFSLAGYFLLFFGLMPVIIDMPMNIFLLGLFLLMFLGGLFFIWRAFSPIIGAIAVRLFGKEIHGIIYGYKPDTISLNGAVPQIAIIYVNENNNAYFLECATGKYIQEYGLNTEVTVKVFKKYAFIKKGKKRKIRWK